MPILRRFEEPGYGGDVATCIPPLGWPRRGEIALAVAPFARLNDPKDAAGLVEHRGNGAARARSSLGVALGELHRAGSLSAAEVEQAAGAILAGTAQRLYFGSRE